MRHQPKMGHRHVDLAGMALAVAKCADLLHPRRSFAERVLRDTIRGSLEGFTALRNSPRQRPALALARVSREQDRELASHCRHQNHIDAEGGTLRGSVAHASELVTFCD